MLDNQSSCAINILPSDLQRLLFSYLNLRDLFRAGLVSKLWQNIFQDVVIWRRLIDQHFPYLQKKNKAQYQADPKALFLKELKHIDDYLSIENSECALIVKPYLLTALRGEIKEIEPLPIIIEAKELLYVYATANGHQAAFDKLRPHTYSLLIAVAAKNSYFPAIRMILSRTGSSVENDVYSALIEAAANGRIAVLQTLLAKTNSPRFTTHKQAALKIAAEYGQLEVIQTMLTQDHAEISLEDKGCALDTAAAFGHVSVVQVLLPSVEARKWRKQALHSAATYGHPGVVQVLLTSGGFLAKDKISALKIAVVHDQLRIVHIFLTQERSAIPVNSILEALILAQGHHDVLKVLSLDLESWRPLPQHTSQSTIPLEQLFQPGEVVFSGKDQDKGRTLCIAAEYGHLKLVQTLLAQQSAAISTNSKLEALIEADKRGYHDIVQVLSLDLQSPPLLISPAMTVTYTAKRKESAGNSPQISETMKNGIDEAPNREESSNNKRAKLG